MSVSSPHIKSRRFLRALKSSGLLWSLMEPLKARHITILIDDTVVFISDHSQSDENDQTFFIQSESITLAYEAETEADPCIQAFYVKVLATIDHQLNLQHALGHEILNLYRDQSTLLDAAKSFSKITDRYRLLEQAIDYVSHWTSAFMVNGDQMVLASNIRTYRMDDRISLDEHRRAIDKLSMNSNVKIINQSEDPTIPPRLYFQLPVEASSPVLMILERDDPFDTRDAQRVVLLASLLASYSDGLHYLRERQMLSRYMPPPVVDDVLNNATMDLGGAERNVTVLFTDIRDFTGITMRLGAAKTVSLLNMVYELLVDDIRQFNGIVDKFMGDGVLAVFGTPLPDDQHAQKAFLCAKQIYERIENHQSRFIHPIHLGITLCTGGVISGNIGSKDRMDYTIIGNCVNNAVKLQSYCKLYRQPIIMDRLTHQRIHPRDQGTCKNFGNLLFGYSPPIQKNHE